MKFIKKEGNEKKKHWQDQNIVIGRLKQETFKKKPFLSKNKQKRSFKYLIWYWLLFIYNKNLNPFSIERKLTSNNDQQHICMLWKNAFQMNFTYLLVKIITFCL